jgi:tetratricopeptide (TPR) repeat protein
MDPNARAAYDAVQQRTRDFESANASNSPANVADDSDFDISENGEHPEQNYREGLTALQQGRINAAINHLGAAARVMPGEARYRAHYGKALAASERMRRLAEVELQEAVRLDPRNPSYRVLLAGLYIDLGFHRRAQTELERALAIDPNSASANSLLRKVQKKQKTV